MKILWFTNTPSLAKSKVNQKTYGGGWMESLQEKIQALDGIELGLSFYSHDKDTEPFIYNQTHYFPLPLNEESKSEKIVKILFGIKPKSFDIEISKYISVIEKFKPDIIHVFGTEYPFGLVASLTKVPVLIWIQGNLTVYNNKWFSGFSEKEQLTSTRFIKRIKKKGILDYFKQLQYDALREQEIFRRCKYFLGRTDWDRRITSILSPQARYFHCDEMLRAHFYQNKFASSGLQGDLKIVSVLNPNIYKGFETIFEAMALLKNFPFKIRWDIVGVNSNDEIIKLVKSKVNKQPEELNITCLGKLDSEALADKLLNSDLFIHPSHIENSPNSICEAMILGLPVICTFAGGTSSLVENKKDGIIVQDGDAYSLAGTIIECIKNYDLYLQYGKNARERSLVRHNQETIVHRLLSIYEEIINLNKTQ